MGWERCALASVPGEVCPQAPLCRGCCRKHRPWGTQLIAPWGPSPGQALELDSSGGGGLQRRGRLLWHEMKGREWGCWQPDRRAGGGVGWGKGR